MKERREKLIKEAIQKQKDEQEFVDKQKEKLVKQLKAGNNSKKLSTDT